MRSGMGAGSGTHPISSDLSNHRNRTTKNKTTAQQRLDTKTNRIPIRDNHLQSTEEFGYGIDSDLSC